MATYQELSEAIQKGNAAGAKELTTKLLASGQGAGDILNQGLLDGMEKIGRRFKANEVYIPEVLIAARAMNQSMEILRPELVKAGVKPIGKMLLGTVKGDLHDIGKNLVKMMAQGAGLEVVDLGIDVSADKFVQGIKENPDAKAIGMSALLTTTMTGMKDVVDRLQKEEDRKLDRGARADSARGCACPSRREPGETPVLAHAVKDSQQGNEEGEAQAGALSEVIQELRHVSRRSGLSRCGARSFWTGSRRRARCVRARWRRRARRISSSPGRR